MEKDAHNCKISRRPYYPELPTSEVVLNLLIYCSAVFGTISSLLSSSQEKEGKYFSYRYLEKGWHGWIGRYKDSSDFEWSFWEKYFLSVIVIGFAGHFVTARFADAFFPSRRFEVYFLYSIIFTVYIFRISGLVFLLLHFSVQYCMAYMSESISVCWISGCMLAYSTLDETCSSYVKSIYPGDQDRAYFLLFSIAICNLRSIAFSMEYVWSLKSQNNKTNTPAKVPSDECKQLTPCIQISSNSISNHQLKSADPIDCTNDSRKCLNSNQLTFFGLLQYQMYYPIFYGGPVMNYNEFAKQMIMPPVVWSHNMAKTFLLGIIKYLFWHFVIDLLLHFFYVSVVSSDYTLLQELPYFDLLGVAFAKVMFFGLKYVCMYGLPAHFATSDNLVVSGGPHCVFAKHRMTDMWKYFDKGLHQWLVRYIYIPSGGSHVGALRMTVASILPFAFVCFWHGVSLNQVHWAILSWFGVYLEAYALALYKSEYIQALELEYLTPVWSRRLRGLFSAPLLFLLLTSNLYFLCGVKVGNLFWRRLYYENWIATALMLVVCYAGCQTSMELERRSFSGERRKNVKLAGLLTLALVIGSCFATMLRR